MNYVCTEKPSTVYPDSWESLSHLLGEAGVLRLAPVLQYPLLQHLSSSEYKSQCTRVWCLGLQIWPFLLEDQRLGCSFLPSLHLYMPL